MILTLLYPKVKLVGARVGMAQSRSSGVCEPVGPNSNTGETWYSVRGKRTVRANGSEPEDASGSLEHAKGDEAIADRGGGSGRERGWGKTRKNMLGIPSSMCT